VVTDLPELEDTYRKGGVNLVNALGVGVADDKAVFPYVPAMIERYLGEEPVLRNAPTISLWDAEERSAALERLPELVLKPRDGYGGQDVLIGPEADRESRKPRNGSSAANRDRIRLFAMRLRAFVIR
jgi:glutamate---cysteine ligase / carboxylate-amine ligase